MQAIKANETVQERDPNLPEESYVNLRGVAGNLIGEDDAKYFKLQNEKYIHKGNSHIVLGRDRPGSALSGYGGKGEGKASSIDIVVGRISCVSNEVSAKTKAIWSNPDFRNDAARIHISQKTDIDKNFDLPAGSVGMSTAKSGIGIKADSIRLVARSGIKIVSSNDTINSMGLNDTAKVGIDLIAGIPYDSNNESINLRNGLAMHRDNMQPIPKGDNLLEALDFIAQTIEKVIAAFNTFVDIQMNYNNHIMAHNHIETFNGNPGIPSLDLPVSNLKTNADIFEKTIGDSMKMRMGDLNYFRFTYLNNSPDAVKYINSRYHNLN